MKKRINKCVYCGIEIFESKKGKRKRVTCSSKCSREYFHMSTTYRKLKRSENK